MADSIAIFPPGYRVLDTDGDPVSGASIEFYDAGTTDARTVYSDNALSTALGTIVYCDSSGAPVASQGSASKVAVYTGTTDYKVIIKDSDGNTLETKDNLRGATNTTPFLAGDEALPTWPVVAKTADYTILTTDQANVINVDCTAATRTMTLPSAVSAGDNWVVAIRHIGSANKVTIATVSSQTISAPLPGGAATSMSLTSYGESVELVSDGANWHVKAGMIGLKLGSGYHYEVYDIGTIASGTVTPDPEEGNLQKMVNNGAFTLAVPAEDCSLMIQITNGATAGTITTSAYTIVSGDSFTTTNGDDFFVTITRINGFTRMFVEALQ